MEGRELFGIDSWDATKSLGLGISLQGRLANMDVMFFNQGESLSTEISQLCYAVEVGIFFFCWNLIYTFIDSG